MIEWVGKKLGKGPTKKAEDVGRLSANAKGVMLKAFSGLKKEEIIDYHCHIVGVGNSGNGCCIKEEFLTSLSPLTKISAHAMITAAGITDLKTADQVFFFFFGKYIYNIYLLFFNHFLFYKK